VELDANAMRYLDMLAPTLRPGDGQVLVLEGQARGNEGTRLSPIELGQRRAQAVKDYLVERHGFRSGRIEPRTWLVTETQIEGTQVPVDARLIIPTSN
jgi:outer membrane protein OmpA-like peptidoglycan-associated protein